MRRASVLLAAVLALLGLTTPAAPTTTTDHVAAILVSFDGTLPFTATQVQTQFDQAAAVVATSSDGQYAFTTTTLGPFTITAPTVCDMGQIRDQARAQAGDLTGYAHVAYVFPYLASCNFAGSAEMGGDEMWFNGLPTIPNGHVVVHELGHNLGFAHAASPTGATSDPWSPMGYGRGTYDGWERSQLGWLTPTVGNFGTFQLAPLDTSGQRVLTIGDLWLDYRPETYGIVLRRVANGISTVIDTGPPGCDCYYVLNLGESWQDPSTGTWFTTIARNASGATVVIGSAPATTTTSTTTTSTSTTTTSTSSPPVTTSTKPRKPHH